MFCKNWCADWRSHSSLLPKIAQPQTCQQAHNPQHFCLVLLVCLFWDEVCVARLPWNSLYSSEWPLKPLLCLSLKNAGTASRSHHSHFIVRPMEFLGPSLWPVMQRGAYIQNYTVSYCSLGALSCTSVWFYPSILYVGSYFSAYYCLLGTYPQPESSLVGAWLICFPFLHRTQFCPHCLGTLISCILSEHECSQWFRWCWTLNKATFQENDFWFFFLQNFHLEKYH